MIEKYLKEYNEYKTKIRLLEIEIDDSISLGSKSDDPLPGRVSARSNVSVVERQADRISDMRDEVRELRKLVSKIDEILNTLSNDDQMFIRLRYVSEIPMNDLAKKYSVDVSALYKRKSKIIDDLSKYASYLL